MLVIDASAVTELLLGRSPARRIEQHLHDHRRELCAPELLYLEVLSALRRLVADGEASPARAQEAVEDLLDLPLRTYPHRVLLPRIWQLRHNLSSYDAAYVCLAEGLSDAGVPLLTADRRLARAIRTHTAVEVLAA